jgi:hypothetical protein
MEQMRHRQKMRPGMPEEVESRKGEMMECSIQEFVEAITKELRRATPQVREEFRRSWLAQIEERIRENDRLFLKSCGVAYDGE